MLKNTLDNPLAGTSLLLDRASHRGFLRVQANPVSMNPSANRMLKIPTGRSSNGETGSTETNQPLPVSEGALLHSCSFSSGPFQKCPATLFPIRALHQLLPANGFFYDLHWVMVGCKLGHAWELPRNSHHHLITFIIKVMRRLKK